MAVEIRLLGAVEATVNGESVELGGTKQRALLAMLALQPNRTVTVDRLIDGLWGEAVPATAPKIVQGYVSHLRKVLPDAIATRGRGYELQVEPNAVDATRLEALVTQAGDGSAHAALDLWRGGPLADVAGEPFAAPEIRRLEELWLAAAERAVEEDLAAGRHLELVPRLDALVGRHPLRERLHAQRMVALYRAGRQAEALEAYQVARRTLDELGLEPGAELRRLQAAILAQDPGLLHDDLAMWEAARRVDASSRRAAAGREELRAHEAEVADDVIDLRAARERTARRPASSVCPFKGLAPFDPEDAPYFFGREQLVADLIARLVGSRLLAVVGPSGSGKSSAVRAGLLPALADGTLPGSERWRRALMRPGEHPLAELRGRLESGNGGGRILIVVDQFEEVFTSCRDEAERREFLAALVELGDGDGIVVLALRADFYGRCAEHPRLARLMAANQVLVAPPEADELKRAIEGPATRAGLVVEPGLVDRLVADLDGEPGALPLLSSALLELWRRRDGASLRLAEYERSGGVRGAVARLAEEAYADLSPELQVVARRILLRLAGEEEGGVPVRRRVALRELDAASDPEVEPVLGALADRRLITIDAEFAEVAHEALLREWPRLRAWLEEDADGRRVHRHLAGAASDWAERGRDPGDLYRGARMASALDWAAVHDADLNVLEREFLDAARDRGQREAVAARRTNRRLRALLVGAAVLLVVAIAAGMVALDQRGEADRSATVAEAEHLGATALLENQLDRSLLLAREGSNIADSTETRGNLLASLLRSPAALAVVYGDGDRLQSIAASPEGDTVAAGDNDGTVVFWDAGTYRRVGSYQAPGGAVVPYYSPDGRTVALTGSQEGKPYVHLIDAKSRRLRLSLTGSGDRVVDALAFSPDGRRLAGAYARTESGDLGAGQVRVWDIAAGDARGRVARVSSDPTGPRASLQFTPDGRRLTLLTGEPGRIPPRSLVLDAATLRTVASHRFPQALTQELSPDGHTVAVGMLDGTIEFLDLRSGLVRKAAGRHESTVQAVRFSRDGRTLVSAADDQKVITWSVADGTQREIWEGHNGRITDLALSPDGRTAWTASLDSTAIAWDLTGARRIGRRFEIGPPGNALGSSGAVGDRGRTLAVARPGDTVALVDTGTLRVRARLRAPRGTTVYRTRFSADGRLLAVNGSGGYLGLFDPQTARAVGRLDLGGGDVYTPAIGRAYIVAATTDQRVQVYDRRTLAPVGRALEYPAEHGVSDLGITPDDRYFAVGLIDGTVELRDVRSQRLMKRLRIGEEVTWSRFSPSGRLLVVGDITGTARVLSTSDWRQVVPPLSGQAGVLESAAVRPDDRLLAISNTDGTVALWDLTTGKQLSRPLPGVLNRPAFAAFAGSGARLFVTSITGEAFRWDMRLATWQRRACAVAGRQLTPAEWARFVPDRPYERTCPA